MNPQFVQMIKTITMYLFLSKQKILTKTPQSPSVEQLNSDWCQVTYNCRTKAM